MIDVVESTIRGNYRIPKSGSTFVLANDVRVRTNNSKVFGFSLDNVALRPFAFFKDSPPQHLAKMCDAIIIFESGQDLYFALIEQKTGHQSDYEKQLANGKFFCEWLVSLCKEHGYCDYQTIKYLAALVWEPRDIPLKGGTTHALPEAYPHRLFDKFFDIQNETDIYIDQLASSPLPSS